MSTKVKIGIGAVAIVAIGILIYWAVSPGKTDCEYYTKMEFADAIIGIPEVVKVKYYPNWYNCHKPERGDLGVYFIGKENPTQYVRVIRALEGDTIQVQPDAQNRGWNLIVNREILAEGESPTFFGVPGLRPTIALYLNQGGKRILTGGEIVVLALASPGYFDSGLFGLYAVSTLKGKIVPPDDVGNRIKGLLKTIPLSDSDLARAEEASLKATQAPVKIEDVAPAKPETPAKKPKSTTQKAKKPGG